MSDTRRVYVPLDDTALEQVRAGSGLPPTTTAFAVTAVVRRAFPDDDEEELEYAALWIAAGEDTRRRRVVAALDLPSRDVEENPAESERAWASDDDTAPYRVRLPAGAPHSGIVSLHVGAAGAGPDDELDWYDASELDTIGPV